MTPETPLSHGDPDLPWEGRLPHGTVFDPWAEVPTKPGLAGASAGAPGAGPPSCLRSGCWALWVDLGPEAHLKWEEGCIPEQGWAIITALGYGLSMRPLGC